MARLSGKAGKGQGMAIGGGFDPHQFWNEKYGEAAKRQWAGVTPPGASFSSNPIGMHYWNEDQLYPRTILGWLDSELDSVRRKAWA